MTITPIAASGENEIIADMALKHINFRTWAALFVLGTLTVLFAMLGNWQLDRAAQRDAIYAEIQQASSLPPITLDPETALSQLTTWRNAEATGHWLHRYTVLIENRNHEGRPGYWVGTPLQLDSDGNHGPAVLVLRGWLPREVVIRHTESGAQRLDPNLGHALARHESSLQISGQIFSHVPRLFELWSWSDNRQNALPGTLTDTRNALPVVQNLELEEYRQATGLALLPVVLAASNPEPGNVPTMIQDWPHPSSDSDTNRGYALQWFSFCVIAAGAWLFIVWRILKRPVRRKTP